MDRSDVAVLALVCLLLGAIAGAWFEGEHNPSPPVALSVLSNVDAGIACFVAEPPHSGMQCIPLSFFDEQEEDPATFSVFPVDTLVPFRWLTEAQAVRDSLRIWSTTCAWRE